MYLEGCNFQKFSPSELHKDVLVGSLAMHLKRAYRALREGEDTHTHTQRAKKKRK